MGFARAVWPCYYYIIIYTQCIKKIIFKNITGKLTSVSVNTPDFIYVVIHYFLGYMLLRVFCGVRHLQIETNKIQLMYLISLKYDESRQQLIIINYC